MPDGAGSTGTGSPSRDDRSRAKIAGALALVILIIVAIVLILWPRPVTVPDVVGKDEAAARQSITAAGFSIGAVGTRTVETSANGTVLDQDPAGGTSATAGSAVALTVGTLGGGAAGAGAPPSSLAAPPSDVQVPGVVGQTETDAVTALGNAGFRVTSTTGSCDQPVGSVITQFPSGGVMAPAGSTVEIAISTGLVSGGNAVAYGPGGRVVPTVLGLRRTAASRKLTNAGYSMSVTYAPSTTTASGLVFYQTPAPGPSGGSPAHVSVWISTGVPRHGRPFPLPPGER